MNSPGFWNIFTFIRVLYGSILLGTAREYINQSTKMLRLECHLRFKNECLNNNVVPIRLHCKTHVDTPYGRTLARNFSRNCLKARIQDNKQQIQQARRRVYAAETCPRSKLRPNDFHDIIRARKQAEDLERSKCTEVHRQKLSRLLPRHRPEQDSLDAVHNFSSKRLLDNHMGLLSKGLNFAMAPRKCLNVILSWRFRRSCGISRIQLG
ncbi:unnamed protein product [Ixodes persulcatus]